MKSFAFWSVAFAAIFVGFPFAREAGIDEDILKLAGAVILIEMVKFDILNGVKKLLKGQSD